MDRGPSGCGGSDRTTRRTIFKELETKKAASRSTLPAAQWPESKLRIWRINRYCRCTCNLARSRTLSAGCAVEIRAGRPRLEN
jgi:hypothetical protein